MIAPTYNNAASLIGVLDRISKTRIPLIVVNDGASDDTGAKLEGFVAAQHEVDVTVVTHVQNRGKAAAMRTGFAHAREAGYTHAVTIDTDGQLSPEEIPMLVAASRAEPSALVLGRRSQNTPDVPKSSLAGWLISGVGLWAETGLVLQDSQCGLRCYPLALLDVVACWAGRFGFEAEIIARAVWAGCPIVEVPVSCLYAPKGERVSHLKPVRDGLKGFFMHWGLAIRRLIPWPAPRIRRAAESLAPPHGRDASKHGWASLRDWVDPLGSVRQVRSSRLEQWIASSGVGYGVFCACMPIGVWALAAAVYGSRRLHHNLWAALLGASLALPPVGPALAKVAITIGYVPMHFGWPDFAGATPGVDGLGAVFRAFPAASLIGGIVLGTALHWVTVFILLFFFRGVRTKPVQ